MIGPQATGTIPGIVICATSHEGLQVVVNGKPARLAIVDESGNVIAVGDEVAREAEAVALNNFRSTMMGKGYLRSLSKPISSS
ncbi:hypothetical protein [Acidovorax sp. sic0104]|nr:hypothetical protein [Acidovorax sp. sic0104]MBV7541031.1 hypothetical protein [Acidovorax sp. sic0104]